MKEFNQFVESRGGTVVELGSRDGHDAKRMSDIFGADRVITIDANPHCWGNIERDYPEFENHNLAISNKSGQFTFYAVRPEHGAGALGQSSTLYRNFYKEIADEITVNTMTMDEFVRAQNIESIEAMKIDVEGATFEVLQGFSNIRMTRLFHIESEHKVFWEGQHLFEDTKDFMEQHGYEQVYFATAWVDQSDTIWRRID